MLNEEFGRLVIPQLVLREIRDITGFINNVSKYIRVHTFMQDKEANTYVYFYKTTRENISKLIVVLSLNVIYYQNPNIRS